MWTVELLKARENRYVESRLYPQTGTQMGG